MRLYETELNYTGFCFKKSSTAYHVSVSSTPIKVKKLIEDLLNVSKSRKKDMMSQILQKNERWGIFMYWKMPQRSFFWRIWNNIFFFRDLPTFMH